MLTAYSTLVIVLPPTIFLQLEVSITTALLQSSFLTLELTAGTSLWSYGSRHGNDKIMARGTFTNIRIVNKLLNEEVGPKTIHIPSCKKLSVLEAAMRYKEVGLDTIILVEAEYGSGPLKG